MTKSTSFFLCLSCFILIIIYLESRLFLEFKVYLSNYILSKQPIDKAGIRQKANSNQDNGLQKQELRQWMNEKEQNYQKDKEIIQQMCKKCNITSKKLIENRWIKVDRNHRIAVCSHAKVGLSTWTYHFRDLLPAKIFSNLSKQINTSEHWAGFVLITWE